MGDEIQRGMGSGDLNLMPAPDLMVVERALNNGWCIGEGFNNCNRDIAIKHLPRMKYAPINDDEPRDDASVNDLPTPSSQFSAWSSTPDDPDGKRHVLGKSHQWLVSFLFMQNLWKCHMSNDEFLRGCSEIVHYIPQCLVEKSAHEPIATTRLKKETVSLSMFV